MLLHILNDFHIKVHFGTAHIVAKRKHLEYDVRSDARYGGTGSAYEGHRVLYPMGLVDFHRDVRGWNHRQ